jgi:hypothetical protein
MRRPLWREDGSVIFSSVTPQSEPRSVSFGTQGPVLIFPRERVARLYPPPPRHGVDSPASPPTRRDTIEVLYPPAHGDCSQSQMSLVI